MFSNPILYQATPMISIILQLCIYIYDISLQTWNSLKPENDRKQTMELQVPFWNCSSIYTNNIYIYIYTYIYIYWLVVWNNIFIFPIVLGISSSQLLLTPSFFRGVGQPPTSISYIYIYIYTLWLFNTDMEAMAHRNRWFSQRTKPPFMVGDFPWRTVGHNQRVSIPLSLSSGCGKCTICGCTTNQYLIHIYIYIYHRHIMDGLLVITRGYIPIKSH